MNGIKSKIQRICILLVFFIITFLVCSNKVFATNVEDFNYEIKDGKVTITEYKGEDSEVIVPDYIEDYPVKIIGPRVFLNNKTIETVKMSDNIEYIYIGAFYYCSSLKNIKFSNKLKGIDNYAFQGCTSLESIDLPDTVSIIGEYAFGNCTALSEMVLPKNVTFIGNGTFRNCYALKKVEILSEIDKINYYVFDNCKSLEQLKLSDSIKTIGNYAFRNCISLKEIELPKYLENIGEYAFDKCTTLQYVNLPDSITEIGEYIFNECNSLEEVKLSNNMKKIPKGMFQNCTSLKQIILPDSITKIESYGFYKCESLVKIILSNNLRNIELWVFEGCKLLEDIEIPNSVEYIGNNTFKDCTSLKEIVLPPKLEYIYDDIFENCSNLIKVTVPRFVYIYNGAFENCNENLTIYGYINTQAETFAKNNSINFVDIATYYTVIFKDYDGTILKTEKVEEGYSATRPENPRRKGYIFIGWDGEFSRITEDKIITAQYQNNTYTVIFKDYNGTVLKTEEVEKGNKATEPEVPRRKGYTFIGWDSDFSRITEDRVITAQYEINTYIVIFKDYDGTILRTEKVEEGKDATKPENPTRRGYIFIGWDNDFSKIAEDKVIMAKYQKREIPFTDINEKAFYMEALNYMYMNNFISGTTTTTFEPNTKLTRAMLVTILWNIEGKPEIRVGNKFPDVANGRYCTEAIKWAAYVGVVNGYQDGTFAPDKFIARQEVAAILANYSQYKNTYINPSKNLNSFKDGNNVSNWAKTSVRWATENKVINGKDNGTLIDPGNTTTRCEAIAMIKNYFDKVFMSNFLNVENEYLQAEINTTSLKKELIILEYDLEKSQNRVNEAEKNLNEAKNNLEYVESQRTVRMYINGEWVWVADREKVQQAQIIVDNAGTELNEANNELSSMEFKINPVKEKILIAEGQEEKKLSAYNELKREKERLGL